MARLGKKERQAIVLDRKIKADAAARFASAGEPNGLGSHLARLMPGNKVIPSRVWGFTRARHSNGTIYR